MKIELGLQGDTVPEGIGPEQAVRAREALKVALQSFGRELVSSLQFYQGQPESLGIRELVLAGGTAQLTGLAAELERLVGVPVARRGPARGRLGRQEAEGLEPSPAFAVPIGLGMAQ